MFVLVASHCLELVEKYLGYSYVAGGLDHDLLNIFFSPDNYRMIDEVYFHPEFDKTATDLRLYDIGMI